MSWKSFSPFWSWRGTSSRSWAHRSRSPRGTCTPPSCSAQAAAKKDWISFSLWSFRLFFHFFSLSPYRRYAVVSWLFHRVMLVWVWKRSFCPDPPPSPYYCGCRQIMESTFHIFCLWHPHFDVPMFQSRAKKESAESWSKLHKILLFQLSPVLQSCASIFYFLWKTL